MDLTWNGVAAVLYETLYKLLFTADEVVLEALLPCLIKVLDVGCHNPVRRGSQQHDDVLDQVGV